MKLTPLWISSKVTHYSCTKSTLCSAHKDSPVAKTFNTLTAFNFFSFLWDQVFASQIKTKEEFCWVKRTPLWISSKVTHYSCTKSTLCSAHKDSPVAKTFNTLTAFPFPLFCGTKSLHHRLRLRKRFVEWLWVWLLSASALNHPSLVQSPLSVQSIKTVQWPKHSANSLHFLFLFFWDKVFASQIKTKKEICWVKLTPCG